MPEKPCSDVSWWKEYVLMLFYRNGIRPFWRKGRLLIYLAGSFGEPSSTTTHKYILTLKCCVRLSFSDETRVEVLCRTAGHYPSIEDGVRWSERLRRRAPLLAQQYAVQPEDLFLSKPFQPFFVLLFTHTLKSHCDRGFWQGIYIPAHRRRLTNVSASNTLLQIGVG
jgi:hypothetical protein